MYHLERNNILDTCLLLFAFFLASYRFRDVFLKTYGKQGRIYYRWTLNLLSFFHITIGVITVIEYLFFRRSISLIVSLVSCLIFLLGQILRNSAVRALGRLHSPHIEIRANHKLVTTFPFNICKHPYYLGAAIEVLTTPLIFCAYNAFLFAVVTYLPAMLFRIFLEEKVMRDEFGSEYLEYENRFIWFLNSNYFRNL